MFRALSLTVVSMLLVVSASAQEKKIEPRQILQEMLVKVSELSPAQQTDFEAAIRQLRQLEQNGPLLRTVSDDDRKWQGFACFGGHGGALVAFAKLKCVTLGGQVFSISKSGVELAAILAGHVAVGYIRGEIPVGAQALDFGAGLYVGVGGSVYKNSQLALLAVGVGAGGYLTWGVQNDSLFGGQLVVEVSR